ncbi:MAG: 30S ribosomal protein S16 [Patescibacteria group bacterium]
MLKIRLQRVGRRHQTAFRLVVTESARGPKSGNFIEVLGNHDPGQKDITKIDAERTKYWISKGAKTSPTVHNLLITKGIIEGKKVNVLPKKTPLVSEDDTSSQEASTSSGNVEETEDKKTAKEEATEAESDSGNTETKEEGKSEDDTEKEEETVSA